MTFEDLKMHEVYKFVEVDGESSSFTILKHTPTEYRKGK